MQHAPVNIPDLLRKARQTLAINSHMLDVLTAVDARLAMLARKHGGDVRDAAVALRRLIAKAMDEDPDTLKGGTAMRRASPIRDEDIFEVAMERFWAAPGGNGEGVKAVIEFCRNVFRDQADDAQQAMLAALKAIRQHRPDHADSVWDQVEEAIAKAEA